MYNRISLAMRTHLNFVLHQYIVFLPKNENLFFSDFGSSTTAVALWLWLARVDLCGYSSSSLPLFIGIQHCEHAASHMIIYDLGSRSNDAQMNGRRRNGTKNEREVHSEIKNPLTIIKTPDRSERKKK